MLEGGRRGDVMHFVRSGILTLVLLSLAAAIASAQPSSIAENYRAYIVALQRGDTVAAEAPAAAALETSRTQFGNEGRTPVLALNLARLRLALGKYREALDPATLAFGAAQSQGTASHIDVVMAQLTLGRAELATGADASGERLRSALAASAGRADLDEDAYAGGLELGRSARNAQRYDVARLAYEAAIAHAQGAPGDVNLARGVARAALGVVLILRANHLLLNESAIREAYPILSQAMREIWPAAQQDDPSGQLTPAQSAFARAMAWQHIAASVRGHLSIEPDPQNQIGGVGCHYHLVREQAPPANGYYPPSAVAHGQEGTVVVRAVLDDAGRVLRTQVAASAPNEEFSPPAASIVGGMRVVRDSDPTENCVMPHQRFISVSFRLG